MITYIQKAQSCDNAHLYNGIDFNSIDPRKDFIQPVTAGENHFVVLTNIGLPEGHDLNELICYDSLIHLNEFVGLHLIVLLLPILN